MDITYLYAYNSLSFVFVLMLLKWSSNVPTSSLSLSVKNKKAATVDKKITLCFVMPFYVNKDRLSISFRKSEIFFDKLIREEDDEGCNETDPVRAKSVGKLQQKRKKIGVKDIETAVTTL